VFAPQGDGALVAVLAAILVRFLTEPFDDLAPDILAVRLHGPELDGAKTTRCKGAIEPGFARPAPICGGCAASASSYAAMNAGDHGSPGKAKQRDVTAAVKAGAKAGVEVTGVKIAPDGNIVVSVEPIPQNGWDNI
jgi:hypothetical protein